MIGATVGPLVRSSSGLGRHARTGSMGHAQEENHSPTHPAFRLARHWRPLRHRPPDRFGAPHRAGRGGGARHLLRLIRVAQVGGRLVAGKGITATRSDARAGESGGWGTAAGEGEGRNVHASVEYHRGAMPRHRVQCSEEEQVPYHRPSGLRAIALPGCPPAPGSPRRAFATPRRCARPPPRSATPRATPAH